MKTRVLITAPIPEPLLDRVRAISPDIDLRREKLPGVGWPEHYTTEAEVLYTTNRLPQPEQAPALRWLHCHWAGIDGLVNSPLWVREDIVITNSSGIHSPNIGQYVMAQMLAWAHRVPRWLRAQAAGSWPEHRWDTFAPDELAGRTLGIIGYGSLGREVARLATAFNMTILVAKRDARHTGDSGYTLPGFGDPDGVLPTRIYPAEAIRSMVGQCDYVVLTLPLTSKTRHLFDEAVFREMKPNAYLINVGRGELINEEHLVKALQRGWIAGAGLDVFETEPLPDSSPLWKMENVILTPHISGFTEQYEERAIDLFAANLRRYLAGEPLFNVVNRQEGY